MANPGETAVASQALAPQPIETPLVFTGRGSEYFRIWVVNTLLTLLTVGIYSAWAKVRRTRYLWQNTRLDGFVFDYHARPVAILRGRAFALVLFGAYSYAFDFSKTTGVLVLVGLCAVGPWLFMRAQQFKLSNTSWRGLRFGFDARPPEAFQVVLPILIVWFSATFAPIWYPPVTVDTELRPIVFAQLAALLVPIPWMHHRLKAYQHRRARYGDRDFSFEPAAWRFYWVYVKGSLFFALGSVVGTGAFGLALGLDVVSPDFDDPGDVVFTIVLLLFFGIPVLVFAWPYLAARVQQITWSATRLGGIRFHTRIRAGRLFWLTLGNVFLTLVTLGLYWPFASMRLAKYRIECMRVETDTPFASIAAGMQAGSVGAGGEGVTDAFGLDLGL